MEYTYDAMNRVLTKKDIFQDPNFGNAWVTINSKTYSYKPDEHLIIEQNALDVPEDTGTYYHYNSLNQLTKVQDPVSRERGLDFTTKYEYDPQGRNTAEINAKGLVTSYRYDNVGNLKEKTIDGHTVEEYDYDALGNLLTSTDGNGNTTTYEYNALGKVRQVTKPGDETIPAEVITYQYDVMGNLKKEVNNLDQVKLYTYDNQGRVLSEVEEKNDGTESITLLYRYDANGNKCYERDGNLNETSYTYDELNRLATITKAGKTTSYTYDANGNKLTEEDWLGNTYRYVYDPINRLIEKQDPYVTIEKLRYNDNHQQIRSTDAYERATWYEYDQNNRLTKTTDPSGHSISQTYDDLGNIETKTDGKGNTTSYTYDWGNRILTATNAKNETTEYTYDNNGNMLTQKDDKGNVTTFEYNARNLLKAKIDHNGRTGTSGNYTYDSTKKEAYSYYADGNMRTMVDRNGQTTEYSYDIHGRLKETVAGKNTTAEKGISYTYDGNGNQLTITDSTGITTREYDAWDRVTSKTVPGIGTSTYQYDLTDGLEGGFVAELTTDPKGNTTKKVYDKAGRLKYVTADGQTITYSYYDNGNRKNVIYPDGTKEEYLYYENNQLQKLTNTSKTGAVLDIYTYTYDLAGNQATKHEIINGVEKGTTVYAYDVLNRLEQVTEPNGRVTIYTYDAAGNRETETVTQNGQAIENIYAYNEQNRLTGITTKTNGTVTETTAYTYDNNGNQLTVTKNGQLITTNTYDVFNQLTGTVQNGTTVTNTYNGEGLRVAKQVNGVKTQYLYEYDKVVLEVDGQGNQVAKNLYGLNLLKRSVEGEDYYYLYNGHADVTALIDTATGAVAGTYYYDAFGNILEQTGDVNNSITYAGYQYDAETGLYYLNARMYDPKIARFLQEDTYRGDPADPLSLNYYVYANNNPLIYYDPSGHWPEWLEKLYKKASNEAEYAAKVVANEAKYVGKVIKNEAKYVANVISKKAEEVSNKEIQAQDIAFPLLNPDVFSQAVDICITSSIVLDDYGRENIPIYNIGRAITGRDIFGFKLTDEERTERLYESAEAAAKNVEGLLFSGGVKVKGLNLGTIPKNALNSTAEINSVKSGINQLEPYAGVKQASEYLKSQGVSRDVRKRILESFYRRTIYMDEAGKNTFGIRYHDFGINAEPKGKYLYETFQPLSTREGAAIKWEWNEMKGISQYQIKPGTPIIKGKAAPQIENGVRYEGGIEQWWISNLNNLLKPKN